MNIGEELIKEERKRQINVLEWDAENDDRYYNGELWRAANCYAKGDKSGWPWDAQWWKPTNKVRNLTKAGALLQAEIDRLERIKAKIADELDDYIRKA